jgi:hypothetical protein
MKNINLDLGYFEADGRKFYLTETLTIERFIEYEKLQNSMGFNLSFKQVFDSLNEIYRLINANKILDGGIKLYNLMNGIAERVDGKIHPALEICALFVIEEGEDISKYDSALAKSKIEAWKKEGYAMQDFFSLAVSLVEGFTESYIDFTENISRLAAITEERITTTEG